MKNYKDKFIQRGYILLLSSALLFTLLIIRIAYVQLTEGKTLEVYADRQYNQEEEIRSLKYLLLDRNGENLVNSTLKYYVVIDPITFYTLNDESAFVTMKNISYILRNYNKKYDISILQEKMSNTRVKYEIDKETYDKLLNFTNIKGIFIYSFTDYDKEVDWNIKNILLHTMKYEDNTQLKDEGTIEREIYEETKENIIPRLKIEEDVSKNIIKREIVNNDLNKNIVTTLDKTIQNIVEKILKDEAYKDYSQIGAVLMEIDTGNILAMAQKDDKLSNVNIGVPSGNGFLMGSIFKTIVYEAALENNKIQEDKYVLKDIFPSSIEKLHEYTVEEAYTASSNNVFAQIGWQVGLDSIYKQCEKLGMFEKVLNLQDEKSGLIEGYGKENNNNIITNTSIGQTVRGTPLEALAIPSAIVNGGIYVKPKILSSIVNEAGEITKKYETSSQQVMSKNTADIIKRNMIEVIESELGTGSNAKVEGVEVGGKTGTTEYLSDGKKYSDGWFTGFFKYNNKYYSMVVFLPQSGEVEGSSRVACTIFKNIVQNLISEAF